jgi:hypothetical protein
MELFFSLLYPYNKINLKCNKSDFGDNVVTDLQLKKILNSFINEPEYEEAVLKELTEFCNDEAVIKYRQKIIDDILNNPELISFFTNINRLMINHFELFNLKMFTDDPQMKTLKTFLITENFIELYKEMIKGTDNLNINNYSEEMKFIFTSVKDKRRMDEIEKISNDTQKIRKALNEIKEIRVNRFFSRGQNIENSISTDNSGISITAVLENLAESLEIEKPDNSEFYKSNNSKEPMKKLLFRAFSAAYKDIFNEIDLFHNKYKD